MRCKYCGSKAIYPDKNHEKAGAGRVIAGAVIAGPVGAVVGLAGKNVKGYRCSTCGSFSTELMSFSEEMLIDSAINEAKTKGVSISYERCAEKYRGIEHVALHVQPTVQYPATPLVPAIEEHVYTTDSVDAIQTPGKRNVKHTYNPQKYVKNSPVLIKTVTIETEDSTDVLRMSIRNVSEKILRSIYFKALIYDDVGDLITECNCVYQGLSVKAGDYLPEDKTFELKTDLAYKVEVICEKAAFTDDSVWRLGEKPIEYTIPELVEMNPWHFRQYKYLLGLFRQRCKPGFEGKLYMPTFEDDYRLCVCGCPVNSEETCPLCGLDEDSLCEIMDYDNLAEYRRTIIKDAATKRTANIQKMYQQAQESKYQEAVQLQQKATRSNYLAAADMFAALSGYKDADKLAEACKEQAEDIRKKGIYDEAKVLMANRLQKVENYQNAIQKLQSISGWNDVDEQIIACQQKIEEIKEREEAERLERELQAELAHKEAARIAKRKRIVTITTIFGVSAIIALLAILFAFIIPNGKYEDAIALMNEGKYAEAISAFEALDGYKDSVEKIGECGTAILDKKYNVATELLHAGKYSEAISAFEALDGHKDSLTQINECKYLSALVLMDSKNYKDAMELFLSLKGYKDSADQYGAAKASYHQELLTNASVGDVVYYGRYEQNNKWADGLEDIEWYVITKDGNKILLLSKCALDIMAFSTNQSCTWDKSTLRTWANSNFYTSAFSDQEKQSILTTYVSTPPNPSYGTSGGSATNDKVFLLSIQEIQSLLTSDQRTAYFTPYAFGKFSSPQYHPNMECSWFLRTPSNGKGNVSYVTDDGEIHGIIIGKTYSTGTKPTVNDYYGFRPAMWIVLNS